MFQKTSLFVFFLVTFLSACNNSPTVKVHKENTSEKFPMNGFWKGDSTYVCNKLNGNYVIEKANGFMMTDFWFNHDSVRSFDYPYYANKSQSYKMTKEVLLLEPNQFGFVGQYVVSIKNDTMFWYSSYDYGKEEGVKHECATFIRTEFNTDTLDQLFELGVSLVGIQKTWSLDKGNLQYGWEDIYSSGFDPLKKFKIDTLVYNDSLGSASYQIEDGIVGLYGQKYKVLGLSEHSLMLSPLEFDGRWLNYSSK